MLLTYMSNPITFHHLTSKTTVYKVINIVMTLVPRLYGPGSYLNTFTCIYQYSVGTEMTFQLDVATYTSKLSSEEIFLASEITTFSSEICG